MSMVAKKGSEVSYIPFTILLFTTNRKTMSKVYKYGGDMVRNAEARLVLANRVTDGVKIAELILTTRII